VFERFTERARQVVVLAQDEARGLKHNYIGTEHLLLGLLREEEGLAARTLESLGVTADEVRARVARVVGQCDEVTTGQIPFTPHSKNVLELSLREALSLGHDFIGTEHLLLGLVRLNTGVASRVLLEFGVDGDTIRNQVIRMLSGRPTHPYATEVAFERAWHETRGSGGWTGFAPVSETESTAAPRPERMLLRGILIGWALFGVAAGIGLLVGWLIWG
jgi:ATP-dependent Clp protease ATP-binding subunit ClpA